MEFFKRILVPVDGSASSRVAEYMAVFLSSKFNSQVTLLHVISRELPALAGEVYSSREDIVPVNQATYQFPRSVAISRPRENVLPSEILGELNQRLRDNGQAIIEEEGAFFKTRKMAVNTKIVEGGDSADSIVAEVEKGDFDLVVMGNSGNEEDNADSHLGSVADGVSSNAKCSVLIVRNQRSIRKMLVAICHPAREQMTLQTAKALALATSAHVTLLYVQESSLLKFRPEFGEIGKSILDKAASTFEGVQLERKLASGDPAQTIIRTAEESDVDIVVIGSGVLGTLRGAVLGSIADHVLHHASFPVLVVR